MTIRFGMVMDPIANIKPYKDSSFAMLLAAQKRGWSLHYMEPADLYLDNGVAKATMHDLEVIDNNDQWYRMGERHDVVLSEAVDVIVMRRDPPFDSEYIYNTYILEAAERAGVLICNNPQSLRDCNEKVFATQFPQCCPPLMVSGDMARLKAFHKQHGDVIFKPLDGMGGSSIFRCKPDDANVSVILEMLTQFGSRTIMAQRYIPEIIHGDKRILMVNGQPVSHALARIPSQGETRGNLAAGGSGVPMPLTERERWIAAQVGPALVERGLYFVGLDVIGDYLTEINVTSPTCIRELDAAHDLDIGGQFMAVIENLLATACQA
jgi:glutathione synthase